MELQNFLSSQSIERLSREEVDDRFFASIGGSENLTSLINSLPKGVKLREHPDYYDLFDSESKFYDIRLAFLENILNFINSFNNKKLTILEGGCATGIDLCTLAHQYPTFSFKGYDSIRGSIELAIQRKEQLGLTNINFYVNEHSIVLPEEVNSADILFCKSSIGSGDETRYQINDDLLSSCRKVKPSGWFIYGGMLHSNVTYESELLDKEGIHFRRTEKLLINPESEINVYNHFYQKA